MSLAARRIAVYAPNGNMIRPERTAATETRLLTRAEAMDRLRLKSSHFSKLVSGKIKGLPKLPVVQIGRCQFFRPESVEQWIIEAEST